jgi:hypothetical protein
MAMHYGVGAEGRLRHVLQTTLWTSLGQASIERDSRDAPLELRLDFGLGAAAGKLTLEMRRPGTRFHWNPNRGTLPTSASILVPSTVAHRLGRWRG